MRRIALIVCFASIAHADTFSGFTGELEGELGLDDLSLVPAPIDELVIDRPRETVEARSAMFDAAIVKTSHRLARAALVLARADLWAAFVAHERVRQIEADRAGRWLDPYEARALADYKSLADDATLHDWAPREGALYRYARVLSVERTHEAAKVYEHLLHDYPKTPYRFAALVALADYERHEGIRGDALVHYREVSAHATDARLRAYAFYREGVILVEENPADSFVAFEQTLATKPQELLANEARKGLVRAFGSFGEAADAWATFARIWPDPSELMDDLSDFYVETSRGALAVPINQELLRRFPDDDRICLWQSRVVQNLDPLLAGERAVIDEAQRMVDVFHHAQHVGAAGLAACRSSAVTSTYDEAGRLAHAARASRDRDYAKQADRLYELFLRTMPDDAHVPAARRERAQLRAEFP